jgi:hypothetical protein
MRLFGGGTNCGKSKAQQKKGLLCGMFFGTRSRHGKTFRSGISLDLDGVLSAKLCRRRNL